MAAYTDTFDRADGYLTSPWTVSAATALKIVNNALEVMTTSNVAVAANATGLSSSDQYARIKVESFPAGSFGAIVRADSTFANYYAFRIMKSTVAIVKVVAGASFSTISGTAVTYAVADGDVIEARAIGSTISGWVNGVKVTEITNTEVPTGTQAGLRLLGSSVGTRLAEFAAGEYSSAPVDSAVPSNVSGFSASNVATTSATLSWNAATDDVGVAGYELTVVRNSNGTPVSGSPFSVTGTSRALTGLTEATGYTAGIRAVDTAGKYSSATTSTQFTTSTGSSTPDPGTGTIYIDDFNRADESFTSPWLVVPSSGIKVVSNAAEVTTTSVSLIAGWQRTIAAADMLTRFTVTTWVSGGSVAILTRGNSDLSGYYGLRLTDSTVSLIKVVGGGTFSTFASGTYSVKAGDVIEIRAVGTKITGLVNNSIVVEETDTSISNGDGGGLRAVSANVQGFRFDNFTVSSIGASSTGDSTPPTAPGAGITNLGQTTASLTVTSPSTDASGISGYQYWDGSTLLGTTTALSWPLTNLTAGTTYTNRFSIAALDNSTAKNASSRSYVTFTTTASSGGTNPPVTGYTLRLWTGSAEVAVTNASLRYWDGTQEYGFDYGRTAGYWTGSQEIRFTLPEGRPAITRWLGSSYIAYGDSSGYPQGDLGENGIDYTSTQMWPHLTAGGWSGSNPSPSPYPNGLNVTVTNRHLNSATNQDVANRMLISTGAFRWVPGSAKLVTVFAGGNDVGTLCRSDAGARGYANAIRTHLGILRSSSKVTTFTETGSWSANATNYSGNTRVSTTPGSTISVSFSADSGMVILHAPISGEGSDFTYTVDGGSSKSLTTKAMASSVLLGGQYAPLPIILRGLGSGTHTVKITHTGASGDPLIVDSALPWYADEASMPFVLLFPPALFAVDPFPGYPLRPTNNDVRRFRGIFDGVLAEYGFANNIGRVLADRADIVFPSGDFTIRINDKLHPNLQGNKLIAQTVLETLRQYAPT